ncbi:hypothetical protein Tco_0285313, partial [Tanacetum coccineum]
DLLQVVVLFALAWMDFHELELTSDLLSIGVDGSDGVEDSLKVLCIFDRLFVGRRRPSIAYAVAIASSQKNKRKFNEAENIVDQSLNESADALSVLFKNSVPLSVRTDY